MTKKFGYRGYIASRPIMGNRMPQHVQNLVIRDYARRHEINFKLSATEYVMPGCSLMLNGVLNELHLLDGIILYSLFMLPDDRTERQRIYSRVFEADAELHAAVEEFRIADESDARRVEDIWKLNHALGHTPKNLRAYRG